MRHLGLDLGSKTIGLALSDQTGLIASSYLVLRHQDNPTDCLDELLDIIRKEDVEILVLGYPKNMNNTIGPRAKITLEFKNVLEKASGLEVVLEDERLTTKVAESILIEGNTRRTKRKKVIDSLAATIILQSYLDKRRK